MLPRTFPAGPQIQPPAIYALEVLHLAWLRVGANLRPIQLTGVSGEGADGEPCVHPMAWRFVVVW